MTTSPARLRLLFLTPFAPCPDGSHGGARVIGQLIERLAERHEAAVLYLRAPGEPRISDELRRRLAFAEELARTDWRSTALRRFMGAARAAAGVIAGRPAWATDWAVPRFRARAIEIVRDWRPEVVQAEFHVMAQYLGPLHGEGSARVLVEHEPGLSTAIERLGRERGARHLARRLDIAAWRRYERGALSDPEAVVAFTECDRTVLAGLEASARIVCIPPGVAMPPKPLDPVGVTPPRVLFVGNFVHPPNVEAALRLARAIFPDVRAHYPEATLEIVGKDPPRELLHSSPGVVVRGEEADVGAHLDRAALVAVPIRLGGGMRVKVMDALAAGKAVVATPRALAGLSVVPGEGALIAETDAELRDGILELLRNPDRRASVARAGRGWAAENLRWDDAVAAYESLYRSLLVERSGGP